MCPFSTVGEKYGGQVAHGDGSVFRWWGRGCGAGGGLLGQTAEGRCPPASQDRSGPGCSVQELTPQAPPAGVPPAGAPFWGLCSHSLGSKQRWEGPCSGKTRIKRSKGSSSAAPREVPGSTVWLSGHGSSLSRRPRPPPSPRRPPPAQAQPRGHRAERGTVTQPWPLHFAAETVFCPHPLSVGPGSG